MNTESEQNIKRMFLCPRFKACSCPQCPLDELFSLRARLNDEPVCPYLTNKKGRRIRPIPQALKQFLKPAGDGRFESIFEKAPPEVRKGGV